MRFEDEFLVDEIVTGTRKKWFLSESYPQRWLADDYENRKNEETEWEICDTGTSS